LIEDGEKEAMRVTTVNRKENWKEFLRKGEEKLNMIYRS
jgi:hypothetical protein